MTLGRPRTGVVQTSRFARKAKLELCPTSFTQPLRPAFFIPPILLVLVLLALVACSPATAPPTAAASPARNLVLITIDTLRADHVGAYGYSRARTPALDHLAREGTRFAHAYTPAPITLAAHASLLTGLYPPGHGARHNGMPMRDTVPTLATILRERGFSTGAFVAAFPLDRRFGLSHGFDVYSDRMPRDANGRLENERPGREVVDEAAGWLSRQPGRFFLWVHLFEPHAPYGNPEPPKPGEGAPAPPPRRPAIDRYDDEIAIADGQVGRLLDTLGTRLADTLVVVAGDHGESFGEHGEVGHSLFVYDTTLRVPLIVAGPGVAPGRSAEDRACLVDLMPTALRQLGIWGETRGNAPALPAVDGIDLSPAFAGRPLPARALYAESFAPLLDFGWSPLRSLRDGPWKAIAAPRPELFDIQRDMGEDHDASQANAEELRRLLPRIERFSAAHLSDSNGLAQADPSARARLRALGYLQGAGVAATPTGEPRPDPKDRRELAAEIERATSGEVQGADLLALLTRVARLDPANGQVRMRLGYALVEAGRVGDAEPQFAAAIAARVPSADPYLGLALCQARRGAVRAALATLAAADGVEPGNPVVQANIGLLAARAGRSAEAAAALQRALELDPDLHEARFNLALTYARAGRRREAADQAADLLRRLPATAPQRAEVERLLHALQ